MESDEASNDLEEGDQIFVNLNTGEIGDDTKNRRFSAKPIPDFMMEIIQAGGLVDYMKGKKSSL